MGSNIILFCVLNLISIVLTFTVLFYSFKFWLRTKGNLRKSATFFLIVLGVFLMKHIAEIFYFLFLGPFTLTRVHLLQEMVEILIMALVLAAAVNFQKLIVKLDGEEGILSRLKKRRNGHFKKK